MIAMLFSKKSRLAETNLNVLVEQRVFELDDLKTLDNALDFLLSLKDLCVSGSNIFYEPNIERIKLVLGKTALEITSQYERHTAAIQYLCRKAHKGRHFQEQSKERPLQP